MVIPDEKLGQAYDKQRTSDFSKLATAVDAYYLKKNELPKNLSDLTKESKTDSSSNYELGPAFDALNSLFSGLTIRDPQTNKKYVFKYSSQKDKDYELCTAFFAKSSATDKEVSDKKPSSYNKELSYYDNSAYSSVQQHKIEHDKGYNCVKLKVIQIKRYYDATPDSYSDYGGFSSSSGSSSSSVDTAISTRDSQRKSDLGKIRAALEAYAYEHEGHYPYSLSELASGTNPYIKSIPKDPKNNGVYIYSYKADSSSTTYVLTAHLEDKSDKSIKSGTSDTYEVASTQ